MYLGLAQSYKENRDVCVHIDWWRFVLTAREPQTARVPLSVSLSRNISHLCAVAPRKSLLVLHHHQHCSRNAIWGKDMYIYIFLNNNNIRFYSLSYPVII